MKKVRLIRRVRKLEEEVEFLRGLCKKLATEGDKRTTMTARDAARMIRALQ